jgi:hypothetical protein
VSAAGQQPAIFETEAPLTARIAHNALPAETSQPVDWTQVTTSLWLTGTAIGLKPGDTILFVDKDRLAKPASELWELRVITAVTSDPANNRTRITWDQTLFDTFQSAATDVQLYAMRKRASLFGVNAPDPALLPSTVTIANTGTNDWNFVHDPQHVDLDTVYPDIAPGGATDAEFDTAPDQFAWLVLSQDGVPHAFRKLYRVLGAADRAPLRYTLSSKATGLTLDTDDFLASFVSATRQVTAFVQSEPLAITEQPLIESVDGFALGTGMLQPVAGDSVTVLGGGMLAIGQTVAVIGKRARLQLGDTAGAALVGPDSRTPIALESGDVFLVDAYPPIIADGTAAWRVLTTKGVSGTLTAPLGAISLLPADKADAEGQRSRRNLQYRHARRPR